MDLRQSISPDLFSGMKEEEPGFAELLRHLRRARYDVIETAFLAPGAYIYRIRYSLPDGNESLENEAGFRVQEPSPGFDGHVE